VWNAHNTLFGSKPSVSPQYTKVTDKQTQDRQRDVQLSDSVGRTVLQTVVQKSADRRTRHDYTCSESSGFSEESAVARPRLRTIRQLRWRLTFAIFSSTRFITKQVQTTLLALIPCYSLFSHFPCLYDVHRVFTKFAVRSNVIPSHSWRQSINRPTGSK